MSENLEEKLAQGARRARGGTSRYFTALTAQRELVCQNGFLAQPKTLVKFSEVFGVI